MDWTVVEITRIKL